MGIGFIKNLGGGSAKAKIFKLFENYVAVGGKQLYCPEIGDSWNVTTSTWNMTGRSGQVWLDWTSDMDITEYNSVTITFGSLSTSGSGTTLFRIYGVTGVDFYPILSGANYNYSQNNVTMTLDISNKTSLAGLRFFILNEGRPMNVTIKDIYLSK